MIWVLFEFADRVRLASLFGNVREELLVEGMEEINRNLFSTLDFVDPPL